MSLNKQGSAVLLRTIEILYLLFAVLSFYLLIASRTGEAYTVWQVLNPVFIPALFIASFLLLIILFTSEKTTAKLFFIIIHSVLTHSLFSIIFPAGDLSGQQLVLGETRRVFDNTILHGWTGWPNSSISVFIVEALIGTNLQAALSTIFARMLSIDIFYVHLFYIPILWGVLIPIASFLVTKAIGGNEKAAVFSGFILSVFPYTIYFGAISVPNSLGFIFFFFSLYFMLRYISSSDPKNVAWMLVFSLFSFLAHDLTGVMSISLVFLALAFKAYEKEKQFSSTSARVLLTSSFLISVSLLPLSFIYLRFLGTSANPVFTLDKFSELPPSQILGLFLIGELTYSDIKTTTLIIIGPLLAFLTMVYLLYRSKRNPNTRFRVPLYFIFTAFLIILIDYRILKIFMTGLPLNEERLWVLRDFIAAPFLAFTIYAVISSLGTFLKSRSPKNTITSLKRFSKANVQYGTSVFLILNVLIFALLGVWVTFSLQAGYPQLAPLQTTSYELDAVKYIETNTHEKYVVIGDQWTIYAGERIVGISNPGAYYFPETSKTGHDLFANMSREPSAKWMLLAMNFTNTTVAYFIITKPRLGAEEFQNALSLVLQNKQLSVVSIFGDGKLYVFSYKKGQSL